VARLGYSYWAESVYEHIGPVLGAARSSLGLTDRQMTFFVAHSSVDEGHAQEVRHIMAKVVRTPELAAAVIEAAQTTLWLTLEILNQAFSAWRSRHGENY
jgi:pyrroloquinoline quinone (PQQ) biosynthesis protein C